MTGVQTCALPILADGVHWNSDTDFAYHIGAAYSVYTKNANRWAACKIFGIKDPADIIGYPVSRIMDEYDFVKMISQDETQVTDEVFLADYNVYLERIFICDPERTLFTCIMRDVTKARQRRNKIQKTKIHAADLADDIIANQLRIVHEIASLLGETAAETKVAVHDLKEAIMLDEDGDDDA